MRTSDCHSNPLISNRLLDLRGQEGLDSIRRLRGRRRNAGEVSNRASQTHLEGWFFEIHDSVTLRRALIPYTSRMSDAPFSYATSAGAKDGTTVVKLSGPLTLASIFGFQNEFRAMKPPVLIVDLSDCPYMDSAGLGLLMNQFVSAQGSHRHFLLSAVNERIESLFELTQVSAVLKRFPTVEEAEASIS
jgi:anti-anti-sigma factor